MFRRLFTLEEATALLPEVRRILEEIRLLKPEVDQRSADVERLLGLSGGNGHLAADLAAARQQLQEKMAALEGLLGELESTGAVLKGIEEGLIDFPAEREGRTVFLCWRLGEETIAFWHEVEAGFAGRQPL